jgi:hypothetical protein
VSLKTAIKRQKKNKKSFAPTQTIVNDGELSRILWFTFSEIPKHYNMSSFDNFLTTKCKPENCYKTQKKQK